MAEYNFQEIEKKWQQSWKDNNTYKTTIDTSKPKFYALDMFPYPSGAGLHVGHPLGYIASDIVSRYKRIKGFNVLHPMGFDSFGLPAEQYAIQTGQHPAITTEQNIKRYIEQLSNLGFSFDWGREIQTSSPDYYKWTQWIFLQLFDAWYNNKANKAERISSLVEVLAKEGNKNIDAACDEDTPTISADEWNSMSEADQQLFLLKYRLTYISETMVNWCPALGTVLANDEVKDGVSERGGYPVERKKMRQWSMRITAYADRLLTQLDDLQWSDSLKEMQRNWIGKSKGCALTFKSEDGSKDLEVFTTRIDTTFGVTFISIAPEHEWVEELTTPEQKGAVEAYVETAKNRSERDRMSDVKTVSGVFTGSYAINPFNGAKVPIWVADYVLAGYGTGIVMAVPSSDERDYRFASHFNIPIIPVQEGPRTDITKDDFDAKAGTMINSGFLDGLKVPEAIEKAIEFVEKEGIGKAKINFKMRDAIFSRQRYWGEPIPMYFKDGVPYPVEEKDLPITLPEVDEYKPTEDGDPPLGRAKDFTYKGHPLELNTMPGWAGSSWYFYRYMDAKNDNEFVSKEAEQYWKDVDLYLGGSEHATGHLLYSRFWNNFLYDLGLVSEKEAFKKLVNQGMIQGRSNFAFMLNLGTTHTPSESADEFTTPLIYVSKQIAESLQKSNMVPDESTSKQIHQIIKKHNTEHLIISCTINQVVPVHVDVNIVQNDILDTEAFKKWMPDLANAEFILEDGKYLCGTEVEKMSKSKYNVVNPDDIVANYGADTLRMYEMFLGPLEDSKPWNTNGIDGVHKFLKKFWGLFFDRDGNYIVEETAPTKEELKVLHQTIKKVEEDIERLSLNTSVSTFMICVNELNSLKCHKKAILEPLTIVLSPFAPHITEELWKALGHDTSITTATYPQWEEKHMKEDSKEYPISINGKMRTKISFPMDMPKEDIEKQVLADEVVQKWLEGKPPRKVIVVPNKIVNVVM